MRFADKEKHQIFVEPCGLDTEEMYLQGMSSSLPEDVQLELYRTVDGFSRLELMRPAYAIEYDCTDPLELKPTLENIQVEGLYGAGQFNGTSGYEEAAAQGLVAGANAALAVLGRDEFVLERQSSYIGTLIDDLVTKGVSDPYRMMTSRSEFRLYLRQDNADERLTARGRELGLVNEERWQRYQEDAAMRGRELERLAAVVAVPAKANPVLTSKGGTEIKTGVRALELLKRPEISYESLVEIVGKEGDFPPRIGQQIETEVKYAGYIDKQRALIERVKKLEEMRIPEDFSYEGLQGLRMEAREKLEKIRPRTLAQASRIPGVSPNDITQLALLLSR